MPRRKYRSRGRGRKRGFIHSPVSALRSCVSSLVVLSGIGTFLFYAAYDRIGIPAGTRARIFAAYANLNLRPGTVERMPDSPLPPVRKPPGAPWRAVTKIIDGDTLEIDGERVRLIGIDTPESSENNELYRDIGRMGGIAKPHELAAMGREASRYLRTIAEGGRCWLEFEDERVDQYGRQLAYVHLDDGSILNETILLGGYAKTYLSFRFKYKKRYIHLQMAAMARKNGLWGGEDAETDR